VTKFKKAVSALLIAGTLGMVQASTAQAGIVFLPAGVGVAFLIIGLVYNDALLIILDADGNLAQDKLEAALAQKFPQIQDRDVLANLASAIRAKAAVTPADKDGRKTISLDRDQVLSILAPTGLADLDPAAADAIVAQLQ
jgi:hypothetical protein